MGFFRAIFRFIVTLGGLLEGSTERATDAILTSSPEAIRSQFRKAREDAVRDYNQMKDAIAELIKLNEDKNSELEKLNNRAKDLSRKMTGAIELYKKNKNEELRAQYGLFANERETTAQRAQELMEELTDQEQVIETYKARLLVLQESIDKLKEEEAQTVADIVSSRKVNELNDKLKGLSQDIQTKNLDVIREARGKAKAKAKLTTELDGSTKLDMENKLLAAGNAAGFMTEFDEAVRVESIFTSPDPLLEASKKQEVVSSDSSSSSSEDKLDALFKS